MCWKMFTFAALLAVPMALEGAGDAELDRATLRGLKAVHVVIDHLDPLVPKEEVVPADLQNRIEERLREANIEVSPSATEFIGVQISAVRRGKSTYALSLTAGLYQPVLLVRDRNVRTTTKTWEVETILMAEPKLLRQASLESVDDLAARFIGAYRSVNPGK